MIPQFNTFCLIHFFKAKITKPSNELILTKHLCIHSGKPVTSTVTALNSG